MDLGRRSLTYWRDDASLVGRSLEALGLSATRLRLLMVLVVVGSGRRGHRTVGGLVVRWLLTSRTSGQLRLLLR